MSVTPIATHLDDALARLLEQYKKAPRLKSILTGLGKEIQQTEDAFTSITAARAINTAEGLNLDKLGAIVGAERPDGVSDRVYRVIIYGSASANVSQGETENVITTYKLLTQASDVRLYEEFPAGISVFSNGALDGETTPFVEQYLKKAIAAGVKLITYGLFSDEVGFGFAENPTALGFGDLNNPDVGGGLGSLIG